MHPKEKEFPSFGSVWKIWSDSEFITKRRRNWDAMDSKVVCSSPQILLCKPARIKSSFLQSIITVRDWFIHPLHSLLRTSDSVLILPMKRILIPTKWFFYCMLEQLDSKDFQVSEYISLDWLKLQYRRYNIIFQFPCLKVYSYNLLLLVCKIDILCVCTLGVIQDCWIDSITNRLVGAGSSLC